MKKKGISPLIATILLIGITILLSIGVLTWIRSSTEKLQEDVVLSEPVEISFDVEFEGIEGCESSDTLHCYEILIINNENFGVKYLIITITSLGVEVEDPEEYFLDAYQSKIFEVYYDQSLGMESVESKVDVASLD